MIKVEDDNGLFHEVREDTINKIAALRDLHEDFPGEDLALPEGIDGRMFAKLVEFIDHHILHPNEELVVIKEDPKPRLGLTIWDKEFFGKMPISEVMRFIETANALGASQLRKVQKKNSKGETYMEETYEDWDPDDDKSVSHSAMEVAAKYYGNFFIAPRASDEKKGHQEIRAELGLKDDIPEAEKKKIREENAWLLKTTA